MAKRRRRFSSVEEAEAEKKRVEQEEERLKAFKRALKRAVSEGMVFGEVKQAFEKGVRVAQKEIKVKSVRVSELKRAEQCLRLGLGPWSSIEEVRQALTKLMGREPSEHTVLKVAYYLGIPGASTAGWKRYDERLVDYCEAHGLGPTSSVDDVRRVLRERMGREPAEGTVLQVAKTLGIPKASSKLWKYGIQEYVELCRKSGLDEHSSIDDVRRVLKEAGRNISEGTVLNVAGRLGIPEASSKLWKYGIRNLVDYCKAYGLNSRSSIEDVRKALREKMGREPAEGTVLQVAKTLGIPKASSKLWKYGADLKRLKTVNEVIERVLRGERVNVNLLPFDKATRLLLGEELILRMSGLKNREIGKMLKDLGFLEDEIKMLLEESG